MSPRRLLTLGLRHCQEAENDLKDTELALPLAILRQDTQAARAASARVAAQGVATAAQLVNQACPNRLPAPCFRQVQRCRQYRAPAHVLKLVVLLTWVAPACFELAATWNCNPWPDPLLGNDEARHHMSPLDALSSQRTV